jgi:hypothetical protein
MGVIYGVANFRDGSHVIDLPVKEGATWAAMLNRPDSVSCELDMRDRAIRSLDILSATEPRVSVLFASTEDGNVLAWGQITGPREWKDDERTLSLTALGGWQYFNGRIIAPPAAADGVVVLPNGKVTEAFDTKYVDTTLGSIGTQLIEQALAWPGAPAAFVVPAPVAGDRESDTYRLVDYKSVGAALTDLTNRENGPDFAFDARRTAGGNALEFPVRVGDPYLGQDVGTWPIGGPASPVTGLVVTDDGSGLATHVWMQAGRTDSKVIESRVRNEQLIAAGYPPMDLVDTSRTDVTLQATLDQYALENAIAASKLRRSLKFKVRGNAEVGPKIGTYRPGDFAGLDVAAGHPYLAEGKIDLRIVGIKGDETGDTVEIECVEGTVAEVVS